MSIWATFLHLDDDTAPIVYYASHIFPDPLARDGHVGLALIPGFVRVDVPDDEEAEDLAPHPFVRLSVNDADVVLPADQVLEMYHALGDWLVRAGGPLFEVPERTERA